MKDARCASSSSKRQNCGDGRATLQALQAGSALSLETEDGHSAGEHHKPGHFAGEHHKPEGNDPLACIGLNWRGGPHCGWGYAVGMHGRAYKADRFRVLGAGTFDVLKPTVGAAPHALYTMRRQACACHTKF